MKIDWISPMMKAANDANLAEVQDLASHADDYSDSPNVVHLPRRNDNDQPPSNWLKSLPVGTVFLTRLTVPSDVFFIEYKIKNKTNNAVLLWDSADDIFDWVDPELFCGVYKLIEILR